MMGHAIQIRQHYVYLLDSLDTKYSGLLDELYSVQVQLKIIYLMNPANYTLMVD